MTADRDARGTLRVLSTDVAVVGAGPAGIAAAISAAEAGAAVLVIDAVVAPGGQIWRHRDRSTLPARARQWLARLDDCGARALLGATVVDARRDRGVELDVEQGTSALRVEARRLVVATGARERFLPFPGWTLPGVVGIGGAQALLKSGASFADRRVAIAGTGPLLVAVADALAGAGATLVLVAEQSRRRAVVGAALGLAMRPGLAVQAARHRLAFARARYRVGTWVTRAEGEGEGDARLRAVRVTNGRATWSVPCDVLCTGYGLVPGTELARLLGCRVERGAVAVDEWQGTSIADIFCAGETAGIGGVDVALAEGVIAGLSAAGRHALVSASTRRARDRARRATARLDRAFALRPELLQLAEPDTIVCRCEDVRSSAVDPRWSPRQARLYARVGMGPCQGRICGTALETLYGWMPDPPRPPLEPMLISTLIADATVSPPDSPEATQS